MNTRCPASVALMVAVAFAGPAGTMSAQQPGPPPAAAGSQSAPDERSPLAAAFLQAVLPPLPIGYIYAGNVVRGLIPTGLMIGGATLLLVETVEIIDWTSNDESEGLIYLGLAATAGGYVFGIIDAANVAKKRNARIRAAGAALRIVPAPAGVGLALSIPVG